MPSQNYEKHLMIAVGLTGLFFVIEVVGGWLSGSLSLLGDAGHMLRDVFALIISLAALKISKKLPSKTKTFGYHRLEIFAAFLNGIFLIGLGIWILWEAYHRLTTPRPVESLAMLAVALSGLSVNLYVAFKLHGSHDINVRSAFLHVMTDAAFSLAVIVAAVLIVLTGKAVFDPVLSLVLSALIIVSAMKIVKESAEILLDFTPKGIDLDYVIEDISQVEGVRGVHHVHLWSLCSDINVLDAHIYTEDTDLTRVENIKVEIKKRLAEYNIKHSTLEFECEECVLTDDSNLFDH